MTGQIPPYSSFGEVAEWGIYERPPIRTRRDIPDAVLDAWERGDRRLIIESLIADRYDVRSSVDAIERALQERTDPGEDS